MTSGDHPGPTTTTTTTAGPATARATTTSVGTVAELWRFPVKSFGGERVERARFGPNGMAGDRRYALRDPATDQVLTAKRYGALLEARARTRPDGEVAITLPDGTEVDATDPLIDDALAAWLGFAVTLAEAGDQGSTTFSMSFDVEDPEHDLFEWACPPGTFVDLAGAHILTRASVEAASALHPDGDWDIRRFRPNAVLDVTGAGFVEDAWVGSVVHLGGVALTALMPTVRCPMPSRAQPGLARDTGVAATLRDHHDNNLGLYCTVTGPGEVAVGDDVGIAAA